jgi:cytoskeletal protein CcmA (bactofilin family)
MSAKGEISGNEDLLVDGKVEGPISLGQQRLIVGHTGHVTGGLTAREIVIHGKVDGGRSLVGESIEISRDAVVVGDVTHSAFTERLRQTTDQIAAEFGEQVTASSTQHLANLTEQALIPINEARLQIDGAAAALAESREKAKAEIERAVIEAQQKVELLISQSKEVYAEWDTRLQGFRDELTRCAEQEGERFREHLQNVLTTLLSSLRL